MLEICGVSKVFTTENGATSTLENLSMTIKKGEFVSVVGPSGCGKSTLLNIIAGLEQATTGQIILEGRIITGPSPDRVIMFQEGALFPWLRVIDNVEYVMKILGLPKSIRRDKALHYLKMMHLTRFASSYPHELSGGMKQRVALARALAIDSRILLMDEPFAALDSQTRNMLHVELQQIWETTKKTIIFVTHNVEEAVLLSDRVLVMTACPGRLKKEFSVKLARPRNTENVDVALVISQTMKELKEEVEKVANAELDSDWSF